MLDIDPAICMGRKGEHTGTPSGPRKRRQLRDLDGNHVGEKLGIAARIGTVGEYGGAGIAKRAMTEHMRHADGGVWDEANRRILCDFECMKPDQCPVHGTLAQFDAGKRCSLSPQAREMAEISASADQLNLVGRHRVVGGEDARMIIGTQPDEIARRPDAPNTVDGRRPKATNHPDIIGSREEG